MKNLMKNLMVRVATVSFAALLFGPSPALAAVPPTAFAVLAGAAITCTTSTVTGGQVGVVVAGGSAGWAPGVPCQPPIPTEGEIGAYTTFLSSYDSYGNALNYPCTTSSNAVTLGTSYTPGVYCFDAAVTNTNTTLTLEGDCDDIWIFRIGTLGTGALTGTNFTVNMSTPDCACNSNNVIWWTADAATMTDSVFIGSILAGADITLTRTTMSGQLLAGGQEIGGNPSGAVTLTDSTLNYCFSEPQPELAVPVFVIGDVEPHALTNIVYPWGAQWWMNNFMSGPTLPGNSKASFKGYALTSNLVCGGTWATLPGNSPPPPPTIPDVIVVVVTDTVVKTGPVITGNILQIVTVTQTGYDNNPGHEATGPVTSIICP